MSAVTKHIETILKENEKLSSLLKEVVDKTAVECLVNGEELYFHDEPPHTKSGLSGGLYDEKEKIEETPYLCIVEVGGASVESVLDNNRTIQIYVRMPEDNIERIIREIQKTLDNTYGREMEYQDLIYNYYSFNEIGQPLFLEKTDNVVLYSVRYRAGYTVYEKSSGGSGDEPGGEVEITWPQIIKEKFLVKNYTKQWRAESVNPDGIPMKADLRFMDYTSSYGGRAVRYMSEDKNDKVNYKDSHIYGKTFVVIEEDGILKMYSLKLLSDYYNRNKMRVIEVINLDGGFVPQSAKRIDYIYGFDRNGKPETFKALVSKENPFYIWDRYNEQNYSDYHTFDPGITILKTQIYKKDAPDDLVKLLRGLASGKYYQLGEDNILGRFEGFSASIGRRKETNGDGYLSISRGKFSGSSSDFVFDLKKDFRVKEEEDRFLIYYISRICVILVLNNAKTKDPERYYVLKGDQFDEKDPKFLKRKINMIIEADPEKIIEKIKQEDLNLDFDIELDELVTY